MIQQRTITLIFIIIAAYLAMIAGVLTGAYVREHRKAVELQREKDYTLRRVERWDSLRATLPTTGYAGYLVAETDLVFSETPFNKDHSNLFWEDQTSPTLYLCVRNNPLSSNIEERILELDQEDRAYFHKKALAHLVQEQKTAVEKVSKEYRALIDFNRMKSR